MQPGWRQASPTDDSEQRTQGHGADHGACAPAPRDPRAGGIDAALAKGAIPKLVDTTLSEGLVLGLLKQGVRKYLAIFGHGSTDLGEVLRIYEEEGVTRTFNCRNEVAMAHAATALRWQYGEIPAVVTSIGPGALQASPARWPPPRTASASITSTATRRPSAKATTCSRCRRRSRACSAR